MWHSLCCNFPLTTNPTPSQAAQVEPTFPDHGPLGPKRPMISEPPGPTACETHTLSEWSGWAPVSKLTVLGTTLLRVLQGLGDYGENSGVGDRERCEVYDLCGHPNPHVLCGAAKTPSSWS